MDLAPPSKFVQKHLGFVVAACELDRHFCASFNRLNARDNMNTRLKQRLSSRGDHPWTRECVTTHSRWHRHVLSDAYEGIGGVARFCRAFGFRWAQQWAEEPHIRQEQRVSLSL